MKLAWASIWRNQDKIISSINWARTSIAKKYWFFRDCCSISVLRPWDPKTDLLEERLILFGNLSIPAALLDKSFELDESGGDDLRECQFRSNGLASSQEWVEYGFRDRFEVATLSRICFETTVNVHWPHGELPHCLSAEIRKTQHLCDQWEDWNEDLGLLLQSNQHPNDVKPKWDVLPCRDQFYGSEANLGIRRKMQRCKLSL